jgi:F-box and leucine-rich repeat protein 2/20
MIKFFESCGKLKELNIHYSWSLDTYNNNNENVHSLSSNLNALFNNSLLYIPHTLESLTLFRPNIREPQIPIDALKRLKLLKKLSLHCVECINDQALTLILEVIGGNLTSLDLGGYMAIPNRLTDTSVKSIAKYCKNLEHLCLDLFSANATLDSLMTIFTLSDLDKKQKMELSRRALALRTFRVSACRRISYDLLLQVANNCLNLKIIDLSGLNELVDDNLIEILASNATKLSSLDLKACTRLTDKSIIQIAIKCPIVCLILSGINNLTDKIIFVIANNLCQYLEEIYLSGCSKISRVAINYLTDCCIKRLYCEHKCPNVDPNQLWAKNLDTGCYERVA